MPAQPTLNNWLSLAGLIALWGTSFLFISLSLESFSPLGIVAMRVLLGAVVLLVYMWLRGKRLPGGLMPWAILMLFGFFGNLLPFYLISNGQQHVSSGIAGLLMAIMPLATMVMAHYLVAGESLNRFKVLGFCLGLTGVAIILSPAMSAKDNSLFSSLLILLAAISYSLNSVLVRRLPRFDAEVGAAGVMVAASLVVVPVWLWQETPWEQAYTAKALAAIIWMGVGPTGIATVLYFAVIATAGPTFLSNINYVVPVVAYFAGALVLGEAVETHSLSALLLIIAGIALTRRQVKGEKNG